MKKPNYNIIINLFPNLYMTFILMILIISANSNDIIKVIKFKKDGNIIIYDKENINNATKTHLYSPLIYIKMNEDNINFKDNNIFPSETKAFTYAIPEKDISLIDISFEEFTLNSRLILKKYPNLLFNTNKTFSLFSINTNEGYLTNYENYKSTFLEQNNFKFIKHICPNNEEEILFLRIDYFIQMRYTYPFKNNDIIWYSHHIKIIPIYPNNIIINNGVYENDKEEYEEDDFYIFGINNNQKINVIYSEDKDLYAEIKDIQSDFNFNNYYFGNKKRDSLFLSNILNNENPKKYLFIRFPKRIIIIFILLLIIFNYIKNKIKEQKNKNKSENNNNEKIEIKPESITIDTKEIVKDDKIKNNEKPTSPRPKSITNLNRYFLIENKSESKEIKVEQDKIPLKMTKMKSFLRNSLSTKKKDLLSLKRISYRKTIKSYKKKKKVTEEEKIELSLLFKTYLEDINNNNTNNDSTINLNLKNISITEKYKKLYSLLEAEKSMVSSNSTLDYKETEGKNSHQNALKKEFQNNFNYIIDSGRLLKEFKDFHFIGKGGFGVVLKASNILDEGQWAIKIMRINLDLRKAKELNAIQEIKMMSKFKKKNIVRYKTCWFEFAQNDTIKKRERSNSIDSKKEINNKNKISTIIQSKFRENNHIIFEEIKEKKTKRKTSVMNDRNKSKKILEEQEVEINKEINITFTRSHGGKVNGKSKKKRKISAVWDEEDEVSDDSLGANRNFVIKEEGENIQLDDNNDFNEEEEENSAEEEDEEDEDSSSYKVNNEIEENKEIIKEEKENENISSSNDRDSSGYKNLKPEKSDSKIPINESSSNLNDTFSISEKDKENKKEGVNKEKKYDSKLIIYFFIQMEYCSGCPMNYYLSHRKKVPSRSLTSYIFFQMCYAVKHIHEGNIIHRDLKPGNIFIMKDYLIKIGDFGLALNFGKTKNEQGGTYLYQSPEQIENKSYDQKVDIFALGVILLELVSKFETEYERVEVLQGLKKNLYPEYLGKDYINEYNLIKKMTKLNAEERPNIQDIFNDNDFIELINSH